MKNYNWWTDPKNAEEAYKYLWWEHPENKETYSFPISAIQDGKYWVVASNSETEKLIGDIGNSAQSETKDDAIKRYFEIIKWHHEFLKEESMSFKRWVPFRKGQWGKIGGNWFSVFGLHIYFRYGKQNKGGWFVPFTYLNISINNDWRLYRRYKQQKKK